MFRGGVLGRADRRLQCGLLLGLFKITSIPIDNTGADVWVGSTQVQSVDLGKPIPCRYVHRAEGMEGEQRRVVHRQLRQTSPAPTAARNCASLLGSNHNPDSAGSPVVLTPEHRNALTLPDSIIVDESDVKRLGLDNPEGKAKINGKEVTLVGTVRG